MDPSAKPPKRPTIPRRARGVEAEPSIVVEPVAAGLATVLRSDRPVELGAFVVQRRAQIEALLREHRALLFRGFEVLDAARFEAVAVAASDGPLLEAPDETTPRTAVAEGVYTSTSYPAHQHIALHNEGSYCRAWPRKLFFCCLRAATVGGATPLADVRRVLARLDAGLQRRFEEAGVLYVRNFHPGLGLSWQEAFWTQERDVVARFCDANDIQHEFLPGDRLRTIARRAAIRRHPQTGERLWFNHAAFFHASALPDEVREALIDSYGDDLPYLTRYGDGTEIAADVIREIHAAYDAEQRAFAWASGDVLLLDNMTIAHGRSPFEGERRVVVALSEAEDGDGHPA